MAKYSLEYRKIKVGDVLQFEGTEARQYVAKVRVDKGRRGIGGMDDGSPDTTYVEFVDGSYVRYDPWTNMERHYVPFQQVGTWAAPIEGPHRKNLVAYVPDDRQLRF